MDKPITVARQEFMNDLVSLINNSGLPAFILTPILEGMTRKVAELEQEQYEADLKAYKEGEKENAEN